MFLLRRCFLRCYTYEFIHPFTVSTEFRTKGIDSRGWRFEPNLTNKNSWVIRMGLTLICVKILTLETNI